jgi:NAD(P)-dependent dehydrogenase (short-subunit alcohol dehydrogenase family)
MGNRVVLHARDNRRAAEAGDAAPGAAAVVVGDLSSLAETRALAGAARANGPYDVVVHNAGVGGGADRREVTGDGIERIFQVNTLAPYVLTALMERPARLVYLTSGLEAAGRVELDDLQHAKSPWNGMNAYSDSKLCDVLLTFAVARRWSESFVNAVDPGWVKTKMGGPGAPDPLPLGAETQVWLATSVEPAAMVTSKYFKHRRQLTANRAAYDEALQDGLLRECASLSGVELPLA